MPTTTAVPKPVTWPVPFTPHASNTVHRRPRRCRRSGRPWRRLRHPRPATVGEPAVLVSSDDQPGLVDPGGQALHRAATAGRTLLVITCSRAGLAPHRPDPRT